MAVLTRVYGKFAPAVGITPGVILINPKFARNVGAVVRACACFDVQQVVFTENRVDMDMGERKRLPREERMKGYRAVELVNFDYPFDLYDGATPVAVEFMDKAESLYDFQHPENAVYVFGPEDGSLGRVALSHCHRFVTIPSAHCLNLAAAVYVVLYDRMMKSHAEFERGTFGLFDDEDRIG